jgi:hypothetical protein
MPLRLMRILARRPTALALAVGVTALTAVTTAFYWAERSRLAAQQHGTAYSPDMRTTRMAYECPLVQSPPTVAAGAAALGDDEPVVGVVREGKARAYALRALTDVNFHIINDVVGDVPVTVTYCDLSGCVRGFGGRRGDGPLSVRQAGTLAGRMVVQVGGVGYCQETGAIVEQAPGVAAASFPYGTVPLERTVWGAWKAAHPDTDVYVGDRPPAGP